MSSVSVDQPVKYVLIIYELNSNGPDTKVVSRRKSLVSLLRSTEYGGTHRVQYITPDATDRSVR